MKTLLLLRHAPYGFKLRRNRYPLSRIVYYLVAALWYAAALVVSGTVPLLSLRGHNWKF